MFMIEVGLEFYQQHYEIPKAEKLYVGVDWTHTHRGIISPTEVKYIITGWFTFIDPKTIGRENEKIDLIQQSKTVTSMILLF